MGELKVSRVTGIEVCSPIRGKLFEKTWFTVKAAGESRSYFRQPQPLGWMRPFDPEELYLAQVEACGCIVGIFAYLKLMTGN